VCQASDKQDAGQWVAPVGGHVRADETDLEALTREVEEEIGVKHFDHKRIGIARFHRQVIGRDENHLFVVYEISTSDPITLNPEAVDYKTFTTDELCRIFRDDPEFFGDALHFVFEKFYPALLPDDWIRHWD
jgi:8-oxo-dGTP pyrophosphatase MutT (NUDIX family)